MLQITLLCCDQQSEGGKPHLDTAEVGDDSAVVGDTTNAIITTVLSTAIIIGLEYPPCLNQVQWEVSERAYPRLIFHLAFQWQMMTPQY